MVVQAVRRGKDEYENCTELASCLLIRVNPKKLLFNSGLPMVRCWFSAVDCRVVSYPLLDWCTLCLVLITLHCLRTTSHYSVYVLLTYRHLLSRFVQ